MTWHLVSKAISIVGDCKNLIFDWASSIFFYDILHLLNQTTGHDDTYIANFQIENGNQIIIMIKKEEIN